MTTYSIYFENQSTRTHNYGFFSEEPKTTSSVGVPTVYSNVLLSQSVAADGNWTIDITNTYYAWCGKAPTTLKPGIVVTTGNGKLATLGTKSAPGSTWEMYNNGGSPAFQPTPTYTSSPTAFEIDTINDFTPSQNFLIGLGAVDGNGRMKPAAVIEADPNSIVQIQPQAKFYLATFNSSVGTVISTTSYSKTAAIIDFTQAGGQTACTVIQNPKGDFDVTFYALAAFVTEVSRLKTVKRSSEAKYKKLLQGLQQLLQPTGTASGPAMVIWVFALTWVNTDPDDPLTEQIKEQIYKTLRNSLTMEGYTYFTDKNPGNTLELWMTGPPKPIREVQLDWGNTIERLGMYTRFVTNTVCWQDKSQAQSGAGSIEAKKQKALTFLQDEGLLASNGVRNGVSA